MTGNMQMMMKFRDLQVAEDFSKMAELGYLDKEFTMYGAAFEEEGKRRYIITSEVSKLYDFDQSLAQRQVYLSPVLTLTKVCPVPSGCDDDIARSVKIDLAKKLAAVYSKDFFAAIQALSAAAVPTDEAEALLSTWQEQLDGCFVEEKLQLFEGLARYAFIRRILTEAAYQRYQDWLRLTRREMEDDVTVKDLFERTFYGYAQWQDNQSVRYITNANKGSIYLKWRSAQLEGQTVTPIFTKTYGYNYTYTVNEARDAFKSDLRQILGATYLETVAKLSAMRCAHTIAAEGLSSPEETQAKAAWQTLARQWGIR